MATSHSSTPKPSAILALVALGLVVRFEPSWANIELQQAAASVRFSSAASVRFSPERLSRLVTRAVAGFELLLKALMRRGRPATDPQPDALRLELARVNALLHVATSLLATVQLGRRQTREQIVGAYDRLHNKMGMSQARICEALSVPVRTLRSWLEKARARPVPTPSPPTPKPKPKRDPRRGRFGFDVVLPDTVKASDTTGLTVLGVELKLIAVQDVGGRDTNLLDGVLIGPTETSEMVAKLMSECLAGQAGAQMVTDQGTPYMATGTVETLDDLEVEHAPQREGHPTGKATLERAFRSIKDAAQHLLALTNHLATSHPLLRDPDLAASLTHLIVDALLRAYQHGARMAHAAAEQRGSLEPGDLEQVAKQAREQARALERSARLLLEHIHDLYGITRNKKRFIDDLRLYPLEVLKQAEKDFRTQVHRDDIRDRASYFCAIVRRCHDEYRRRQARLEQEARERRQREEHDHAVAQQRREHAAAPTKMVRDALDLIALQWDARTKQLLFGGEGPGKGMLRRAFDKLTISLDKTAATDIVVGVLRGFELDNETSLDSTAIQAIRNLASKVVGTLGASSTPRQPISLMAN